MRRDIYTGRILSWCSKSLHSHFWHDYAGPLAARSILKFERNFRYGEISVRDEELWKLSIADPPLSEILYVEKFPQLEDVGNFQADIPTLNAHVDMKYQFLNDMSNVLS